MQESQPYIFNLDLSRCSEILDLIHFAPISADTIAVIVDLVAPPDSLPEASWCSGRAETMAFKLLTHSVIQLDVAADAGADCDEGKSRRHKRAQNVNKVDVVEWRLFGQRKAKSNELRTNSGAGEG